jgi:hypothetical protein
MATGYWPKAFGMAMAGGLTPQHGMMEVKK